MKGVCAALPRLNGTTIQDTLGKWTQVDIHDGKGPPMPTRPAARFDADVKFIKDSCEKAYKAARQSWMWGS